MSLRDNDYDDDTDIDEKRLTLIEHLDELRSRIIKILVSIAVGTSIAFAFSGQLVDFLIKPCIRYVTVTYYTSILQPFNVRFKAAMFAGIIFASPVILYQLWKFISPAMTPKEKKVVTGLFGFAVISFLVGISFAYLYMVPMGTKVLMSYGTGYMKPLIGIEELVNFVVFFSLAMGAVFEVPLVMMGLAKVGIVRSKVLRKNWRFAILGIFFVSFAVTPGSEIMTSLILAIPLFLLYELSIVLIKFVEKKRDPADDYDVDDEDLSDETS